jgi:hypothetical protein
MPLAEDDERRLPVSTPMAEATTKAKEAPIKTVHLLKSLSAAKSMVASWVFSPSSAMKTAEKTVMSTFQSTESTCTDQFDTQAGQAG